MLYKVIFIIIFISSSAHAHQNDYVLDSNEDFEKIETRLQKEPIIDIAPFENIEGVHSTHKIKIVTLESGLKGLFKTGEYHYAEVAGYRLSKLLNISLVPPTIFRTIDNVHGSLQLYIAAPNLASIANRSHVLKKAGKKVISEIKLFYYLAGQWDTHYGNQIIEKIGKSYRVWLVDNSGMLHRSHSEYGGRIFIEKGTNSNISSSSFTTFPFNEAVTIKGEQAYTHLSPFITKKEHLRSLAKHPELTYLIGNSTLWLAYCTEGPSRFGRYTTTAVPSILNECMNLTRESIALIWAEWLIIEPSLANELIELTLYRRDELLRFFS